MVTTLWSNGVHYENYERRSSGIKKLTEVQRTSTQEIRNRQSCIVQIHTDDGLVGIGDAQRPESPEAMCYLIKDLFPHY